MQIIVGHYLVLPLAWHQKRGSCAALGSIVLLLSSDGLQTLALPVVTQTVGVIIGAFSYFLKHQVNLNMLQAFTSARDEWISL